MKSDYQQHFPRIIWRVLFTFSFALALCVNVTAQVTASAAISGTVKDKAQAVIRNAKRDRYEQSNHPT